MVFPNLNQHLRHARSFASLPSHPSFALKMLMNFVHTFPEQEYTATQKNKIAS